MILDRLIDESDTRLMMSKQSKIDIWSHSELSRSTRWSFVPLSVTSPIAGPENNIYSYPGIYQYLTWIILIQVRRVKATPAPKQFIDEQATKQANLKVSPVLHRYNYTSDRVLKLFFLS